MQSWLALIVAFFSIFTQTLTGFGAGMLSMAFLPGLIGMRTAVPLVALATATLELIQLIRLRARFNFPAVWRLMLASLVAIPLGVWALRGLNEKLLLLVLGIIMLGYALYALLTPKLPGLEHPLWAYLAGFISGLLGGAYSVSGPPVIIYGTSRGWEPDEFRSNLQGFFLVGDCLAILNHALVGNLTPRVWISYLWALPVVALGLLAGTLIERFINPQVFSKLVLILMLLMGLRYVLSAFWG